MSAEQPASERADGAWLAHLPEALRPPVVRAWEACAEATARTGLALPAEGELRGELARVWAASRFVAESCARAPGLLDDLVGSGDLARGYAAGELAGRVRQGCAGVGDEAGLARVLRLVRRREMVRIAWRDLAGSAGLGETLHDLSDLAEACIDTALAMLHGWQVE